MTSFNCGLILLPPENSKWLIKLPVIRVVKLPKASNYHYVASGRRDEGHSNLVCLAVLLGRNAAQSYFDATHRHE